MARGKNYWEMTYDPEGREPNADKSIHELTNLAGFEDARINLTSPKTDKADERLVSVNHVGKKFTNCDLNGSLEKSSFRDCEFVACYFLSVKFEKVKFTNCTFRTCHFLFLDIENCHFIDCHFKNISVAAEHFKVASTEIYVTPFLAAVETNLNHLPPNKSQHYQLSRLKRDKAKLAQMLYRSNQGIFSKHYFTAHKELVLWSIRAGIEEHRYLDSGSRGDTPRCRGEISFLLRTLLLRTELLLVYGAGALTAWGQSVSRAILFMLAVAICFSSIYKLGFGFSIFQASLRSIDVSLVAGYTAHTNPADPPSLSIITLVNLVLGIYWYSLIVPVITRKFLR